MKYHLEGKRFRLVSTTDNGQVGKATVFDYHQDGDRVWAEYSGGDIVRGNLIAIRQPDGTLDMRYHHITIHDELMHGTCQSTPSIAKDNLIQFDERWKWLSGDMSMGTSVIREIKA